MNITPKNSRRFPAVKLTDLDYADYISLLSDEIEQTQEQPNWALVRLEYQENKDDDF